MDFFKMFDHQHLPMDQFDFLQKEQHAFRETLEKIGMERYLLQNEMIDRLPFYVDALKNGALMVLPTDTLYALSCRAFDVNALEKLYRLKGRSLERQIPIFIENTESMVDAVAQDITKPARLLMEKIWPGPLTLVLKARPSLPKIITGNTGSVGVRQSGHPLIRKLVQALGEPITGTSANLTAGTSPKFLKQIAGSVLTGADYVVDGGGLLGQKGSTVLDFTGPEVTIIRQGDCPLERIREVIDVR